VTRWWYIHRIVATVAFRFLLAAAIAAVLGQFIGAGEETKIIAGLVLGVFATYVSTLSSAVFQGAQPKLLVGETVIVELRPRRQLWPPSKIHPPALDDRQYVIDVSLEGIHMTAAAPREQPELPEPKFVREARSPGPRKPRLGATVPPGVLRLRTSLLGHQLVLH